MTKIEKIKDLHNFFISEFRPKFPVQLRICKMENYSGLYTWDVEKKEHNISIDKHGNWDNMVGSFLHEWSHLLQKYKDYNIDQHSKDWGIKYSKVYNKYMKWMKLQEKV
jgi:hypothetical protein